MMLARLTSCLGRSYRSVVRTRWGPSLRLPWNYAPTIRDSSHSRLYCVNVRMITRVRRNYCWQHWSILANPIGVRSWCNSALFIRS